MPPRTVRLLAQSARRRPVLGCVLAAAVIVSGTAGGTVHVMGRAHGTEGAVSSSVSSSSPSAPAPASSRQATQEASLRPVAAPEVDHDALLAAALEGGEVEDGAGLAVAVRDMESGESAAYGKALFETASIVKVDILATLLLQAQDADRRLTAQEEAYAAAMIENSDNASASALWKTIGSAAGLDAANERFGLTGTEGGDGLLWGLTRTTAADQLVLLQQVFGDASELSDASRAYLRELMGRIAVGQDWGVSAAGSGFALKNGWLPRTATGLWVINSIGRVTVDGHDHLVAVLSNGNTTKAKGVALVEAAAKAAVSVFAEEDAGSVETVAAPVRQPR
ncbi:serine hydrolase [Streptomyces sp. KM273126]|uniref:serine hydrolase n=1 Tax=Streptomyces sp. KM273126 TaxID=2545247 RepID=UPI001040ABA5|nr:serine hydrolase [Streptomyces sp. KM273126]MBA2812484.1 serine hydrolase [Streptomyces sp. KM273126]